MKNLIEEIKREKVIAIIRGLSFEQIIKTAEALDAGGIHFIEITFDQIGMQKETVKAIKALTKEFPNVYVGAGTVISPNQVEMAFEAGAKYIISPNVNEKVIELTKKLNMLSIPGAMTPSEIVNAYEYGADIVKIFPAEQLGISYLKAIRAPLHYIPIAAVGGINQENIQEFLQAGACCVGIGSNIVNKRCIQENKYECITKLAQEYIEAAKG